MVLQRLRQWAGAMTVAMAMAATGAMLFPPASQARAIDESQLLPVDEAFALRAVASQRDRVELSWTIAEGYYLYRHRIVVEVQGTGFDGGDLQLPDGEPHHDEFFGDVETYRGTLRATLPVNADAGTGTVALKIRYQGCADLGVCYPPQTRTLTVALPGAMPATPIGLPGARAGNGLRLPGLSTGGPGDPLPDAQAFGFEAITGDAHTLLLRFTPAPGYYLYRDRSSFRIEGADGIAAGQPQWPPGIDHHDEHFGDVVVYFDQVEVPLPLQREAGPATALRLVATFQGCQTDGICYPPMTREVALTVEAAAPTEAEDTRLAAALAGKSRWVALLGFFGAGLLLAFTPCVLPMVPILSGLIAGQGTRLGTSRALVLSLVYVVANALVFTAAGVVAGMVGANLQIIFQKPWIIAAFSALFVALALSSFGLYELQLPASLRARLGMLSDRQRGGSLAGVAAMGALSALIVGPCVAPPLAAAVLYIGQTQDPVFGGAALFLLGMGMGLPLLAFGAAAGRGMPTSGPWMTAVQRVFGFVFLGLAVWMLGRILPGPVLLASWGVLLLAAAAWAFAATTHSARSRMAAIFAGLVLAVAGAAQLLGALAGGNDPLQPLAGAVGAPQKQALAFRTIKSSADLDRELAGARAAGKPLMFDFYADWCVSCKEMEKYTFTDPAVQEALADFVLLKADVTANDEVDQALMQRFGIIGPPGTLFFVDGAELRGLRLVGFEKAAAFAQRARQAAGAR